eukprot:8070064-Alexandrium_andersonii.AAC.1
MWFIPCWEAAARVSAYNTCARTAREQGNDAICVWPCASMRPRCHSRAVERPSSHTAACTRFVQDSVH